MKRAKIVIGAAFGDEGKGLITDYHCASAPKALVVRFNGGAQAGHTVVTPEGKRHVFHHFGSGSFVGCNTLLGRNFVVNPLLLDKERKELDQIGLFPVVIADRRAPLTTPYDMLANQAIERFRGNRRHGSCGVGINETVARCRTSYSTTVQDLFSPATLREKLEHVRAYARARIGDAMTAGDEAILESTIVADNFIEICNTMNLLIAEDADVLGTAEAVVFEGAQGLLLDEEHRFHPHVTRSRTGLENALAIANEAEIEVVDVHYVMRPYMTRHGAGPFPTEAEGLRFEDETNARNEFQGGLRFGHFDADLIGDAIRADFVENCSSRCVINRSIALTHCDQMGDKIPIYSHHGRFHETINGFREKVKEFIGLDVSLSSFGPQRTAISTEE